MADEAGKNFGEPDGNSMNNDVNLSPPVKKKYTEVLPFKNQLANEGESHIETMAKEEGEGATGIQDTHEQPKEKGKGPHKGSLWKSDPSKLMQEAGSSTPSNPLDSEQSPGNRKGPEEINAGIKIELTKAIQQLRKSYTRIFQLLEEAQGTLRVKEKVVEYAIYEAMKFKSQYLIKNFMTAMDIIDNLSNSDNENPNV